MDFPSLFRRLRLGLLRVLRAISTFQIAVLLGVFYYVILGPFAVLYQVVTRLQKSHPRSYWIKKEARSVFPEALLRQF